MKPSCAFLDRMIPSMQVRRSLVRSRVRVRLLMALLKLRRAYLSELAREAMVTPLRAHGALVGDGVAFTVAESLVSLGLVEIDEGVLGPVVRLTSSGDRVARAWRRSSASAIYGVHRVPS